MANGTCSDASKTTRKACLMEAGTCSDTSKTTYLQCVPARWSNNTWTPTNTWTPLLGLPMHPNTGKRYKLLNPPGTFGQSTFYKGCHQYYYTGEIRWGSGKRDANKSYYRRLPSSTSKSKTCRAKEKIDYLVEGKLEQSDGTYAFPSNDAECALIHGREKTHYDNKTHHYKVT